MKRTKKTIILLAALAVLIGGYYGVQQLNQKQESVSEQAGTFDLTAKTSDDLAGLQWTANDTDFSYLLTDGTWQTAGNPAYTVKQTEVQSLASTLTGLQGTRKLENVSNAADYGIQDDSFSVTATWSDGSKTIYTLGDATPFADGYYLQLSGQEGVVYTTASDLSSTFNKTLTDMAAMETIPAADNPSRIVVGSTLDISWQEESTTINPDQHWYDTASGMALDDSDAQTVADNAASLTWETLVSISATEEELASWQLDDAAMQLVCYDGNTAVRTLLIGTADASGNYYARLPESAMVYTISSDDLDPVLTCSVQSLRSTELLPLPWEHLAQAELTMDKGSCVLSGPNLEESKEPSEADDNTNSAGDIDTTEETEEAENADQDLWETLTGLQVSEWMDNAEPSEHPLLTIHAISREDREISISIHEKDAAQYLAVVDEQQFALVSAEKIDSILRNLRLLIQ